MKRMLLAREENERLITEATNAISSEQKKTRDLQQKFKDANERIEKVTSENCNLLDTVDSKEKLIKQLQESKAYSDQKLTDATGRLEFSQKQCSSLKYEVRVLQEELAIRKKEREYDLKSVDAAQKQQKESMKKIAALEGECQRLRTMVQKRLPGPAALAKKKDEVKRRSNSSAENGVRRPRHQHQHQLQARHFVSEDHLVKLQELVGENRHLRQLLAEKSCNLPELQIQIEGLSSNHSEPSINVLSTRLERSKSSKQRVSQNWSRRITGSDSDLQFLVAPLETEKLKMVSEPSSDLHHYVPDVHETDSDTVLPWTVHGYLISDHGLSDKDPRWIKDVLKVIVSEHEVIKMSFSAILDELRNALMTEISPKGTDAANLFYDRPKLNEMVATLLERVRCMTQKSIQNNAVSFRSFFIEKSELILRLERLIHVCSDIQDGKSNLQRFIDEVCLILEWMLNQCFFCLDGLDTLDYANKSDGNESLRTINEKYAMKDENSEMVLGQETRKEMVEVAESKIPDENFENKSMIEFNVSKLQTELLTISQGQVDSFQEAHSVYCEGESAGSDGSKEKIAEDGNQLTSAVSTAAKELVECQETITNLSKRLNALQNPANYADAPVKGSSNTLPLSVANSIMEADTKLAAEADTGPSPTSEEPTRIKERGEPDATEKSLGEEQNSETGPKADESRPAPAVVARPVVPKSPRKFASVDAKKKKRRASLLSRLVFRKKT